LPTPSSSIYRYSHHEFGEHASVHLFPTEKTKTNRLSVYWVGDLGDDVTARALLPSVLARGTTSLPTLKEVTRHLEHLYGAGFSADVTKIGERHLISFRFDFVNDRFLPAGESVLSEVVRFAREVLHSPFLDEGGFPRPTVEQERVALRRHIEGLINDKSEYASRRCIDHACAVEDFRRYEYGTVEALEAITSDGLLQLWSEEHLRAPVHIYFSGAFEEAEALDALSPLMERGGDARAVSPLPELHPVTEPRQVVEEMDVHQVHLVQAYRTGIRYADHGATSLSIANGILGTFPHSKLFQNVREKHGLAYAIGSSLDRSHGMMFVAAGVPADKWETARDVIHGELADLQAGKISDNEFEATKLGFDNQLRMVEDSPGPLAGIDLSWRLSGAEYDHDRYRAEVQAATKDDVVAAARSIELDTVFALIPNGSR